MTVDDSSPLLSKPLREADAEVIIEAPLAPEHSVQRDSSRLPQDDAHPLRLFVGNEEYDVVNSSVSGIAFIPATEDQFVVGQEIANLKLNFQEVTIPVRGSVVHVSRLDLENPVLGVRLIFQNEAEHQRYKEYQAFIRQRLLQSKNLPL